MELAHDLRSAGITAADSTRERLSAVLQLLEVGVTGKTAGWHDGLLSQWPGVRISGRKGDWPEMSTTGRPGGLRPFRGPGAPCAPADHKPLATAGKRVGTTLASLSIR